MSWRAWYTDSRKFNSVETDWNNLPETGVLGVVVYYEPPYREIVSGGDWYYLDSNGKPAKKMTHDEWGKWVVPPDVPEDDLKRGEGTTDERWSEVQTEMMETKQCP